MTGAWRGKKILSMMWIRTILLHGFALLYNDESRYISFYILPY